jgi:hypothetical protein
MSDATPAERLVETWAAYREAALEVLASAEKSFTLFDHDFSATGLESAPGIDALIALARRAPRDASIRILVRDQTYIERHCPRLLRAQADFAHRVSIRTLTPEQNPPDIAFALADDRNLALRFHFESARGRVSLANSAAAAEPLDQFEILWASAANGPAARMLGL